MRPALRCILLATLLGGGAAPLALAAPPAVVQCVEGPAPTPRKPGTTANGLPALGTMVMALGGGLGLVSGLAGVVGVVGAWERTQSVEERRWALGGVGVVFSALALVATVCLVTGFGIWVFAWLPPPVDTRIHCPPPTG